MLFLCSTVRNERAKYTSTRNTRKAIRLYHEEIFENSENFPRSRRVCVFACLIIRSIPSQFFLTGLSRRMDDKAGKEKAPNNRGTHLHVHSRGEVGQAIECHEKDLEIAIEIGDRAGEGEAYGNLGCAFDSMGNFPKAIEYHEKYLKIAIEIGDLDGKGWAKMEASVMPTTR